MTCVFVIYHVMIPLQSLSDLDLAIYKWTNTLNEQLATIALSYFFAITGFLLFRNLSKSTILRKIKSRVMTLLVPYLFWEFLVLGIYYLTGRFRSMDIFTFYLKSMFLFGGFPPNIPLWYIYTVFALTLLTPILLLLLKNKVVGFITVMVSFFAVQFVTTNEACSAFASYGIVPVAIKYIPSFLLGAYFGLHFPKPDDLESLKVIAFVLVFGVLLSSKDLVDLRTSLILASIPMLLIRFFPARLCKERKIYNVSFILYAIHYPIYQYILDLIKSLQPTGFSVSAVNIIFRAVFLPAMIGLSYLLYKLLSRFTPKLLKLITGSRAVRQNSALATK